MCVYYAGMRVLHRNNWLLDIHASHRNGMHTGRSSKQRHGSEEGVQSIGNVSLTFQLLCQAMQIQFTEQNIHECLEHALPSVPQDQF